MHFIDPSRALGVAPLTAAHACAAAPVIFYPSEKMTVVYGLVYTTHPDRFNVKEFIFFSS